jgi:hypothetical protein
LFSAIFELMKFVAASLLRLISEKRRRLQTTPTATEAVYFSINLSQNSIREHVNFRHN